MHCCTCCITALFLDSYISLRIKGGNVGHLILNGLVWKLNRQKESKRPWDVEPNVQTMYYKCISLVNKKCILMFYPSDSLAAHVCLTSSLECYGGEYVLNEFKNFYFSEGIQ